jgi:peptidoglycan/LPS O-acetylase OafA/YrhL
MHFQVSIVQASAVFQPYLVLESTMFILAVFALSFHWSQKGAPYGCIAASIADDSFGIYLAHLFVISYISFLQPAANDWLTVTLTLLIGVPVVYGLSFSLTEIVRHTQLSLLLTGRQMARGRTRSQPSISKATIA